MSQICPIANRAALAPNSPFLYGLLSNSAFDHLVATIASQLSSLGSPIIAYVPGPTITPRMIALPFAAWRSKKGVYPLSFRLPQNTISERCKSIGATLIDPEAIPSSTLTSAPDGIDFNSISVYIETSGTTQTPKLVCHTLKNLFTAAESAIGALSLSESSRYELNLPLFHISGLSIVLRIAFSSASLILPNSDTLATHTSMVPTQLYRLLKQDTPIPPYDCILLGGAPCPHPLFHAALSLDLPIYTTYGMTETGAMATLRRKNIPNSHAGSFLPHIKGKLSPSNEILLRGPSLYSHYFHSAPRDPTSWFPTGDMGHLDAEGNLTITGRKDRQFISGGENIQPEEIEAALLSLPHIIQARVRPSFDPEYGMRPIAHITTTSSSTKDDVTQQLRDLLPKFKIPTRIHIDHE